MPHGGISGPLGGPRPLCTCEQQLVFELEGRGDIDFDTSDLENNIDGAIRDDVSVTTREGRINTGIINKELVVIIGGSAVDDDKFNEIERQVNSFLIRNSDKFQMVGWRIEGV